MAIKGKCRTNLDGFNCSLTDKFSAVPRIGEYVEVAYMGHLTTLKVVSITHKIEASSQKPYIEIELHR